MMTQSVARTCCRLRLTVVNKLVDFKYIRRKNTEMRRPHLTDRKSAACAS